MDRRNQLGAASTALVVVMGVFAGRIAVIFAAGFVGGLVAGVGVASDQAGPSGRAGAKAAAIGGAFGFLVFVAVGTLQSLATGDLSIPAVLGFQTILLALLVVPFLAILGGIGGPIGVRVRRLLEG